ncbi:hypothetical protein [Leisingera sp. ANG-M7]|uniref:hypothetical protein n=1 Tax=Leisingera sp. ANG-M7 TaxID=1577902 RepID=UPI00057E3ECC|nr:hypothetical protein [Leisingera sp. ANG-M7]KIC35714.1 hypothetical protein RA26_15510 [Leisingera sp. ANG-M7]
MSRDELRSATARELLQEIRSRLRETHSDPVGFIWSRLFPDIQYEPSNREHRKLVETATDWLEAELALLHRSLSADRPFSVDDAISLLRDRVNYIEKSMARPKRRHSGSGRDDG